MDNPKVYIETIRDKGVNDGINEGDFLREIPQFSVKYKDVFSLKNLYIMMHELLLEEGWVGFEEQEAFASMIASWNKKQLQTASNIVEQKETTSQNKS